jgi:hypothetical protein
MTYLNALATPRQSVFQSRPRRKHKSRSLCLAAEAAACQHSSRKYKPRALYVAAEAAAAERAQWPWPAGSPKKCSAASSANSKA